MYFYSCVEQLIFLFLNPVFKKFMYKPTHISLPLLLEIRDIDLQRNAFKNKIKNNSIPGFLGLGPLGTWAGEFFAAGAEPWPRSLPT